MAPSTREAAAASMSASGATYAASLPPSSSVASMKPASRCAAVGAHTDAAVGAHTDAAVAAHTDAAVGAHTDAA
eukprot:1390678-Prymnesium_polylepis.1